MTKHIVCFSGGEGSAKVAIYAANEFGRENVMLLNHDISSSKEHADIKRFKQEVADYLQIPITYANINGITDPGLLPDQFDVCIEAGAITNSNGMALCTYYLKTLPFEQFLQMNFLPYSTLFEEQKNCIIYYGFDSGELARVQRRSTLLGAKGYKTAFPTFKGLLKINSTLEVGIKPPSTYSVFKHANCVGCLKAGIVHWFVVYCTRIDVYDKASLMEQRIGYNIITIKRNKISVHISLEELRPIFEQMKADGVPATEHQSAGTFGLLLRKYQIEACDVNKPCECTE